MRIMVRMRGCISSVSYIKPQRKSSMGCFRYVVYRPFPTSNHNMKIYCSYFLLLYIVRFLHQTTTFRNISTARTCCISSVSYIKPQQQSQRVLVESCCISSVSYIKPQPTFCGLAVESELYIVRFLHQTTTQTTKTGLESQLYIVRFLHQTTTSFQENVSMNSLYIVRFLHQTTT